MLVALALVGIDKTYYMTVEHPNSEFASAMRSMLKVHHNHGKVFFAQSWALDFHSDEEEECRRSILW